MYCKKFIFLLLVLPILSTGFTQDKTDTLNAPAPVLPGLYADPHLAVFNNRFYIYATTDGTVGWKSTSFTCWSSANLVEWRNEGVILDLPKDLTWAKERAWAPCIAEKNGKYYYYYSADVNIGVAVSDKPTGPFKDPLGKPLLKKGVMPGQMIDPMVFVDDDGAAYLFFGQGHCNVVKLNDDMISFDLTKITSFDPEGYNEGSFVFKRNGKYYLMWSEYDTRDPRYSIAYATANSPLGPYTKAKGSVLKGKSVVKGAGHHSVVKVPGRDEWYIAYHRFKIPGGNGYNRETCISSMHFDNEGNILPANVFERIKPVSLVSTKNAASKKESRKHKTKISNGKYSHYLFVYFTGNKKSEEAIRFAVSSDGYNYKALNNNDPIISSEKISSTGGVRDPHILRGANGTFYMVVTDMVSANGWNSNRAMVLMKSKDLINWTSGIVNIQKRFPGHDSLLRVWAPQTIYDAKAGRYMIYWSMKHGKQPDKIYYSYANADFTDLETVPKQLFFSPTNGSCIDGDIVYKDGKYHLFFKTEGEGAGIKIAVSDKLTEGYVLRDKYVQQTKDPVEGAGVFKLNNGEGYILMYDVYTKGRYQFTKTRDLENFTVIDNEVTMDFHPRHGTVLPITAKEAKRLESKWGAAGDGNQ